MSQNEQTPASAPVGHFSWNELLTPDVPAAKQFYGELMGWQMEPFGPAKDYFVLKIGDAGVGGMMKTPQAGMPATWLAYVTVADVDAAVAKATQLGGKVCAPPFDVPQVGRCAVITDPQGAALGLFKPAV